MSYPTTLTNVERKYKCGSHKQNLNEQRHAARKKAWPRQVLSITSEKKKGMA